MDCKAVKLNAGEGINSHLNVNLFAKRKEVAASIFAMKFVADLEILQSFKIIHASFRAIKCLIVKNTNVDKPAI